MDSVMQRSAGKKVMQASEIVDLDDVDLEILRELQQDARISFKAVAQKVGVSEATVFVRVRKLQERHIIKSFSAIVNPKSLGKNLTQNAHEGQQSPQKKG